MMESKGYNFWRPQKVKSPEGLYYFGTGNLALHAITAQFGTKLHPLQLKLINPL